MGRKGITAWSYVRGRYLHGAWAVSLRMLLQNDKVLTRVLFSRRNGVACDDDVNFQENYDEDRW